MPRLSHAYTALESPAEKPGIPAEKAPALPKNPTDNVVQCRNRSHNHVLSCQYKEHVVATLTEVMAAYRICAEAESKSPRTVEWIMSSVAYFKGFLGCDPDVGTITADDLRGFIIALKKRPKFLNHPKSYGSIRLDRL